MLPGAPRASPFAACRTLAKTGGSGDRSLRDSQGRARPAEHDGATVPCLGMDFRMLSRDFHVSWRGSGDLPGPSVSLATGIPHVTAESPETPGGLRTLREMEFRMRRRESPENAGLGDY